MAGNAMFLMCNSIKRLIYQAGSKGNKACGSEFVRHNHRAANESTRLTAKPETAFSNEKSAAQKEQATRWHGGTRMTTYSMVFGVVLISASLPASGQSDPISGFPRKPVRIIVPFPAGGGTDILVRPVAQKLTERWGQQVIVDNRSGAGGTIGSDVVAKSPPDGYNVVLGTNGTHGISQSLYRRLPYDTIRDFTPVTLVAIQANILVVHPSVPVHSVKELIAFAKAKPGELYYGTPGNGTPSHLAGESFKSLAAVNITHVPYKGAAPAIVDLLGGQIQVMFAGAPASLPHIRAGKLRALATTSAKRLSMLAEFPTIAESGLPGYEGDTSYGLFGPAGMPVPLLNKINQDFVRVLMLPEIKETFAGQGAEVSTTSPAQFAPMVAAEVEKWSKMIKQLGLQID